MTAARHGAATLRAVLGSLFVVLVISFGAAVVGRNYFNEQDRHAPFQPPPTRQIQSIAPRVVDAPLERSDPLHALWCERGSNAVIEATADVMSAQFDAGQSEQSMQRALLRAEAQLTQGQVQAALEGSNRMQESLKKHPSLLAMEPAVLEQSARIHIEAGEVNVQKLEAPLRATIEARVLLGTAVPVEAWPPLARFTKRAVIARAPLKITTPRCADLMHLHGLPCKDRCHGGCRFSLWLRWIVQTVSALWVPMIKQQLQRFVSRPNSHRRLEKMIRCRNRQAIFVIKL